MAIIRPRLRGTGPLNAMRRKEQPRGSSVGDGNVDQPYPAVSRPSMRKTSPWREAEDAREPRRRVEASVPERTRIDLGIFFMKSWPVVDFVDYQGLKCKYD